MKKLIIITGQTATGKTELATTIAEEVNGELISADSRQVYKNLDIITGKDLLSNSKFIQVEETDHKYSIGYYQNNKIATWLYDVVDPKTAFSAGEWAQCARASITKVEEKGKTPIIVGGSYFYVQTLLYGLSIQTGEPDWNLRFSLEKQSVQELQAVLNKLQPNVVDSMNNSDKNNKRRLIRRIEIISNQTQNSIATKGIVQNYDVTLIGLKYGKKENLEKAIRDRVHKRIKQGALEEVETLLRMGYSSLDPGLQTIGYAQLLQHIQGEVDLYTSIEAWVLKERQYAKRQMTFMAKNNSMLWYNVDPTNK